MCATAVVTIYASAIAQSLPAGLAGYWRVVKQQGHAAGDCTGAPAEISKAAMRNSKVLLSDRAVVWGDRTAESPAYSVNLLDEADFMRQYGQSGVTSTALGLASGSKIEVIHLGQQGTLPFDTVVVKDPSTVYFIERCGVFLRAVHDSGFIAPPLPEPR
jgi:hypothetical protein